MMFLKSSATHPTTLYKLLLVELHTACEEMCCFSVELTHHRKNSSGLFLLKPVSTIFDLSMPVVCFVNGTSWTVWPAQTTRSFREAGIQYGGVRAAQFK